EARAEGCRTFERLGRPVHDGRRKPGALRIRVEAPVHAVGEVLVRCAGAGKQALVTAGTPRPLPVTRGVFGTEICVRLDDPAGGATAPQTTPQHLPQKPTPRPRGRSRAEGPPARPAPP